MFSHLSKSELWFNGVSAVLGIAFIIAGILSHGQFAIAGNNTFIFTATTTTSGTVSYVGSTASSSPSTTTTTITDLPDLSIAITAQTGSCGTGSITVSWNLSSAPADAYYKLFREGMIVYEGTERKFIDKQLPAGSRNAYAIFATGANSVLYGSGYTLGTAPSACEASTNSTGTSTGATSETGTFYAPTTTTSTATPNNSTPNQVTTPVQTPPVVSEQHAPNPPTHPEDTVVPKATPKPSPSLERALIVSTPPVAPTTSPAVEQKIAQLTVALSTFDAAQSAVDQAKGKLAAEINARIDAALQAVPESAPASKKQELEDLRTKLLADVSTKLTVTAGIGSNDISALTKGITASLARVSTSSTEDIGRIATLVQEAATSSRAFANTVGVELRKDSNHDGISDYESVHVYGIDPVKPSPTTLYNGKKISAGDKVLLGLDPARSEVVKVFPDDPQLASAPVTSAYKVDEVGVTPEKKVAFAGTALPNSYVTLFIYSTPVVVTVKTDVNGRWSYTLDRELEDGAHKITTATVDNSGKILVKSSPYLFTKTAQAATLDSVGTLQVSADTEKPSVFSSLYVSILIFALVAVLLIVIVLIGISIRNDNREAVIKSEEIVSPPPSRVSPGSQSPTPPSRNSTTPPHP